MLRSMFLSLIFFCGMGSSTLVAYTEAQVAAMIELCEVRPWPNCEEEVARLIASDNEQATTGQEEDVSASTGSAGTASEGDGLSNLPGGEQSEPSAVPRLSQREASQVRNRTGRLPAGTFERVVVPLSESEADEEATKRTKGFSLRHV